MTARRLITTDNPILHTKARKVTGFGKDLQALINDMLDTLHEMHGAGLAGPQIGESRRLFVAEYRDGDDETQPKRRYIVINPEITRASAEKVTAMEGCLSVPRIRGEVERHEQIVVRGFNRQGQPLKIKASGWLARIFQHEIDHLDGILFTERATQLVRLVDTETVIDNV